MMIFTLIITGLTYKGHFTFFGLAPGSDYEVNHHSDQNFIMKSYLQMFIIKSLLLGDNPDAQQGGLGRPLPHLQVHHPTKKSEKPFKSHL